MPPRTDDDLQPLAVGDVALTDPMRPVRLASWLLIAALIITGLYVGQEILIPLAIAFLIGFALDPMVAWFLRRGFPRLLAVMTVMLTVAALLAGVGLLLGSQVRGLIAQLPAYSYTMRQKIDDIGAQIHAPGALDRAWKTLEDMQREVNEVVNDTGTDAPPPAAVQIVAPPVSPIDTARTWLVPALAPIAKTGIVIVFVFFVLLDRGNLRDRLIRLLGDDLHRSTDAIEEAADRISRYLMMQVVANLGYGIVLALGLLLIGVPGWLLWGALAALLRFLPYVGALISSVFPLALAFTVDPGWSMMLWTVALIVVLEMVHGNVVEPLAFGTSTGLSAFSLIAAATFWTALWGPVGLILSTPLTVCLLVIGRKLPQLQFFETLLGSSPALDVPTRIHQRLIADDPQEAIEIAIGAIEAGTLSGFYDTSGLEVLRQAEGDGAGAARAEHRLRVARGMELLLDDLAEEYPAGPAPEGAPVVVCIGGRREVDRLAGRMLAHALQREGIDASERPSGAVTGRQIDQLDLGAVDTVCLSSFSQRPEAAAGALCRRLRRRWPDVRIVLCLWNLPPQGIAPERMEALGADEVVTSIGKAVARIAGETGAARETEVEPETLSPGIGDAAPERLRKRVSFDALTGRAAEVFAVRHAAIAVIDGTREYLLGETGGFPFAAPRPDQPMRPRPRSEGLCAPVQRQGGTLATADAGRDSRLAGQKVFATGRVRFFAGTPLRNKEGEVLGVLCLLDESPRDLDAVETGLFEQMAGDIAARIALALTQTADPEA